jgi:hypothetical protein
MELLAEDPAPVKLEISAIIKNAEGIGEVEVSGPLSKTHRSGLRFGRQVLPCRGITDDSPEALSEIPDGSWAIRK